MSASVGIADTGPEQPKEFAFTQENLEKAQQIIAKYPPGRQQSAVMPLLDIAQRQCGNWLPRVAMDAVADMLGMPRIKAYEVATFYSMYNLKPVGKHFVQVCTTTPCWLVGSDGIVDACKKRLGIGFGETTPDGQFTLVEVECLGACVNAPMAQINDDYYEDLTPENTVALLDALAAGKPVKPGSQTGRCNSMAASGPTSLHEMAKAAGVES
jgi:NADH-quinone oxidoreductase subunit E